MLPLHRRLLMLSTLALVGIATPSLAAIPKGECLWNTVPAAQRATMMDNYRAKGMASVGELDVSDQLTLDLRKACKFTPDEDTKAGEVLAATMIAKGSDQMLFEREKIAKGRMDKVWTALPPADKEALTVFGLSLLKGESDGVAAAAAVVLRVTGDLGLPTETLNNDVYGYLVGRAVREAREAGR